MTQTTISTSVQEITDSLAGLIEQTLDTGIQVLKIFGKAGGNLGAQLKPLSKSFNLSGLDLSCLGVSGLGKGCCEIPPPCWMPKKLSAVSSHVCPGATASLRLRIANGAMEARTVSVAADQGATVSPASLELGPFRRGWITVSAAVPAASCEGDCQEILVFVQGCNSYYLHWTVRTAKRGCSSCHEIDIDDRPDYVHHWYDHFYCRRPCAATGQSAPGQAAVGQSAVGQSAVGQ